MKIFPMGQSLHYLWKDVSDRQGERAIRDFCDKVARDKDAPTSPES